GEGVEPPGHECRLFSRQVPNQLGEPSIHSSCSLLLAPCFFLHVAGRIRTFTRRLRRPVLVQSSCRNVLSARAARGGSALRGVGSMAFRPPTHRPRLFLSCTRQESNLQPSA